MHQESIVTIAVFLAGLIVHGCAVFWLLSKKLTQVCEAVKNLRERCKERGTDHKHHFEGLEEHGKQLAKHEVRITHLEHVVE